MLAMPPKSSTLLTFWSPVDPIDPPKKSPKKFGVNKIQWEFPWMVEGYSQSPDFGFHKFFRVFAQEQKGDRISQVTQMLLRLWDLNYKNLRLSHSPKYNGGLVEVYLCFGGKAGGEQLFEVDKGLDIRTHRDTDVTVNTIYIYDMTSFTDPIEMAREVAHEYGHATLPPVGGFQEPEDWADGYLGEKLFLRWIRDGMAKGLLVPQDAMGATKADLDKWIATNVDPLIDAAAIVAPTQTAMSDKSASGMNEFIGLALYVETLFGDTVFARSMKMNSVSPADYPASAVLAIEEPETVKFNIPQSLIGKLIWIPLGTGKLKGAVWIKRDPSGWVQIMGKAGEITISNTPP